MTPKITKNGSFLVPSSGNRARRSYAKTILLGSISTNSPASGELTMRVSDDTSRVVFTATVGYQSIALIQLVVQITELVETSTSPGGQALGTNLIGGQLLNPRVKLVQVKT